MNYITIICPYCKKELFMPEDAKNVVCMYCAKPIDVLKIKNQTIKASLQSSTISKDTMKLLEQAKKALPKQIIHSVHEFGKFCGSTYPNSFTEYEKTLTKSLDLANDAFTSNEASADKFADILFEKILSEMKLKKITKTNSGEFFDVQYFIVTFFIPAILNYKTTATSLIADDFIEKWKNKYPNCNLKKSTYQDILDGFRFKSKWCFITTATCKALNKGDNCYELNVFREFRDRYSGISKENENNMLRYYAVAPFIVSGIDRNNNKEKIYSSIWEKYLAKCLYLIQQGKDDECAELYINMVSDLEKEYTN